MKNTSIEQMDPELAALTEGWKPREVNTLRNFFFRMADYQNRMANWIEHGGRKPKEPTIMPRRHRAAILLTIVRASEAVEHPSNN